MADIVISEFMDEAAVSDLAGGYEVLYDAGLVDRPADLAAALADARALIVRNRTQVNAALLAAAPRLAVVGRLGVGLDNIDMAACEAHGVAVCPATGANAVAVAEYVIATMLVLLRGAYGATARIVAGEWPRGALIGREAAGRRLGLVGLGGVAREVARRARALDMVTEEANVRVSAVTAANVRRVLDERGVWTSGVSEAGPGRGRSKRHVPPESFAGLTRESRTTAPTRWIAGSSPAMTTRGGSFAA